MKHDFRTVQGSPCGMLLAPYIAICANDAYPHRAAVINSIYRGADAEHILNAHGKHSQAQLYSAWERRLPGFLPANPPGYSTHEQKSDGVAYPNVPRGHDLDWWQVGFDVNDADVPAMIRAASKHGWTLFQPYHSGSEFHHLNFHSIPEPKSTAMKDRIVRLRDTLPRS